MTHAEHAERLSLAILAGETTMNEARDDLRRHNRLKELERQVAALRAYRTGSAVWTWPARAPWAGF